jgi:hypothetical protein
MATQPGLKVVVEGADDARIIRAIAGKELADRLRIFASQGRVSLATVGRNILFHEGGPVLLVMDSDTLNPQRAVELRSMNLAALSGVVTSGLQTSPFGGAATPEFKVFTFVPAIEVVFFEAPEALDRLLGKQMPEEKLREGHLIPQQTLAELLGNGRAPRDYHALLADLDPQVQRALASGAQAKALKEMMESLLAVPAKAS